MRLSAIRITAMLVLLTYSGCIPALSAIEGRFERTLNVTGPINLQVFTGSGKIEVRAGSSDVVRVRGFIHAWGGISASAEEKVRYIEANPPIDVNGNSIDIGRIDNPEYQRNVSISYEIETPPETALKARSGSGSQKTDGLRSSVDVSTGSGSIDVANIKGDVIAHAGSGSITLYYVTGRINLNTGSGSIKAEGIEGSVRAGTGSGHITLEQRKADQSVPMDVDAHTGSGSIDITGVYGSLRSSTGSGSIRAGGNPVRDWNIHTSSGSVTIEIAPDAAFDLHASTGSGRINTNIPVEVQGTIGRKEMRGKVRGGGSLVEVHTSSGSIAIR